MVSWVVVRHPGFIGARFAGSEAPAPGAEVAGSAEIDGGCAGPEEGGATVLRPAAPPDAGPPDGPPDAGPPDAGPPDAAPPEPPDAAPPAGWSNTVICTPSGDVWP